MNDEIKSKLISTYIANAWGGNPQQAVKETAKKDYGLDLTEDQINEVASAACGSIH
jgi:hypothetical protein